MIKSAEPGVGACMTTKTPVWRTRDGRRIKVSDLEYGHLKNIVAMIEKARYVHSRVALSCLAYACSSSSGEYAAMAAEQEFASMKYCSLTDSIFDEYEGRRR